MTHNRDPLTATDAILRDVCRHAGLRKSCAATPVHEGEVVQRFPCDLALLARAVAATTVHEAAVPPKPPPRRKRRTQEMDSHPDQETKTPRAGQPGSRATSQMALTQKRETSMVHDSNNLR